MSLAELIERVEKLEGPDYETDVAIARFFATSPVNLMTVAAYTASLDAAVALVERVLPGWDWGRDDCGYMQLYQPDTDGVVEAEASTAPLALVLATLRAKQALDEDRPS